MIFQHEEIEKIAKILHMAGQQEIRTSTWSHWNTKSNVLGGKSDPFNFFIDWDDLSSENKSIKLHQVETLLENYELLPILQKEGIRVTINGRLNIIESRLKKLEEGTHWVWRQN